MNSGRAKVGLMGCGYWGKNLARNFAELGALEAICEVDESKWAGLRQLYPGCRITTSYEHLLNDDNIRGIAIATPAESHGQLVREALLAGKDVFVEKPLSLSVSMGEELVSLARVQERILMVGHLLWYHPAVLKLRELVESGSLGRIQYIYSNRLNLGKIRREENILWSFAPHDVSVILGLVKEMPDEIVAHGGNYLHNRIADITVSLLSFPSGVKAHIFVSWLHPFKEQKLIVVGDKQMAVFDDLEKVDKLVLYPHVIDWKNNMPVVRKADGQRVPLEPGEPLRAECAHFLDCIADRRTPNTDGQEGLRVLTVLQQCQDALELPKPEDSADVGSGRATPGSGESFFAHESAFIDEGVRIGEGTSIWHVSHILKDSQVGRNCRIGQNVVIGPRATVGNGVKIQNNVSVYEGVTLEDNVFCGPSMVFTNVINPRSEIRRMDEIRPTLVKYGASIGANSTIVCGTTIGKYAFIGAGAVVVKDVPDFALVVGNPGRIIGWMCQCGNRVTFSKDEGGGECGFCSRSYRKEGQVVTQL